jgi:hypothetical protein
MKTTPFDKLEAIRIVAACTLAFRMSNTIRRAMAHGNGHSVGYDHHVGEAENTPVSITPGTALSLRT